MEAGLEPVLLAGPSLVFAGLAGLVFPSYLSAPTSLPCPDLGGGITPNSPLGLKAGIASCGRCCHRPLCFGRAVNLQWNRFSRQGNSPDTVSPSTVHGSSFSHPSQRKGCSNSDRSGFSGSLWGSQAGLSDEGQMEMACGSSIRLSCISQLC